MSLFVLKEKSNSKVVVRYLKGVPCKEYSQEEFSSFDMAEDFCESKLKEHCVKTVVEGDKPPF